MSYMGLGMGKVFIFVYVSRIGSPYRSFGYDSFSNPLEIHRHFQQEMEEISRLFETFGNMFGECLHSLLLNFFSF